MTMLTVEYIPHIYYIAPVATCLNRFFNPERSNPHPLCSMHQCKHWLITEQKNQKVQSPCQF